MYLRALLRRLDICQQSFRKTEPALSLPLRASDYLRRHVKFTPFRMIANRAHARISIDSLRCPKS